MGASRPIVATPIPSFSGKSQVACCDAVGYAQWIGADLSPDRSSPHGPANLAAHQTSFQIFLERTF